MFGDEQLVLQSAQFHIIAGDFAGDADLYGVQIIGGRLGLGPLGFDGMFYAAEKIELPIGVEIRVVQLVLQKVGRKAETLVGAQFRLREVRFGRNGGIAVKFR